MIDYFLLIEYYYFVPLPLVLKNKIYAKNLFFINFLINYFLRTTG